MLPVSSLRAHGVIRGLAARCLPYIYCSNTPALLLLPQVAMRPGAPARRALLRDLRREAPFALPPMSVVSVGQLRALGHIPR